MKEFPVAARNNIRHITLIVLAWAVCALLTAAGPDTVTYQGRLNAPDGRPPQDGYYPMKFRLWIKASGGSPETDLAWEEDYPPASGVLVMNGLFMVRLGGRTPFPQDFFKTYRYLFLEIHADLGRDGFDDSDTYSPRVQFTATPWAFHSDFALKSALADQAALATTAYDANALLGKKPSDFAAASHTHYLNLLPGLLTDDQIPNDITIAQASRSGWSDWSTSSTFAMRSTHSQYSQNAETLSGLKWDVFAAANHGHNLQNLTGAVTDAQVPDDITVNYAAQAGLARDSELFEGKNYTWFTNAFSSKIHTHQIYDLPGQVTDAQVPDNITISYTAAAGTATTASNADTVDGKHSADFAPAVHNHNLQDLAGAVTDAQVPDDIAINLAKDSQKLEGQAGTFYRNASNINSGTLSAERIDPTIARISQISPRTCEAVVAETGGDFTTLQDALSAGMTSIYVRNGIYTLTSDAVITISGTTIIGESREGVVISGANGSYNLAARGGTATYNTGTITAYSGMSTVTGAGTSWASSANPGDHIQIGGQWYPVLSVENNTQLTLTRAYLGPTITGSPYQIAPLLTGITLKNLTVKRCCKDNKASLDLAYALGAHVENCDFRENGCSLGVSSTRGILLDHVYESRLIQINVSDNLTCGIEARDCDGNLFSGIIFGGNSVDGLRIIGGGRNSVSACVFNIGQTGILLQNTREAVIGGNTFFRCNTGIRLETSTLNIITENILRQTTTGIHILSSSDLNTVNSNTGTLGTTGIFVQSSNSNTISGNTLSNFNSFGIYLNASNRNGVKGNLCRDNGDSGIFLRDNCDENHIASNTLNGNTNYGFHIRTADCDRNVANQNNVYGNSIAPHYDQGTNTQDTYNNFPRTN